jgi:hypothetical protein
MRIPDVSRPAIERALAEFDLELRETNEYLAARDFEVVRITTSGLFAMACSGSRAPSSRR